MKNYFSLTLEILTGYFALLSVFSVAAGIYHCVGGNVDVLATGIFYGISSAGISGILSAFTK